MIALRLAWASLQIAATLALPPLLLSVIAKTKAWYGGRVGPPWLQPYRDLWKLINKGAVYSGTTTWFFGAAPAINLAALLAAATLVPMLGGQSLLGFKGDLILVAYLLAAGRMLTVLAAMDTGSSFEGMGASREATFAAMIEPVVFLAFTALALSTGELQLSRIFGPALTGVWYAKLPAMLLVVASLLVALLTECCRIPVDDPATHLELTMIHEVMVLDHSGPDFAYITYGAATKFMVIGSLLVHTALPQAVLLEQSWHWAWAAVLARLAAMLLLACVVGIIESTMARLRLNRVPLLLVSAGVLAAIAVLLVLPGGIPR